MKPHLAALAVSLAVISPAVAGPVVAEARAKSPAEWEALFRCGDLGAVPCGPTRGAVLYADGRLPRVKARIQGGLWKGKTFHGDGVMTNRWVGGVEAGSVDVRVEASWMDGKPCLVMQYPPTAPVFGNVRDEVRQVAPGVWLGRSYDAATGRPKHWFLLQGAAVQ